MKKESNPPPPEGVKRPPPTASRRLLQQIPQQPQRQDSTHGQLSDLYAFAIRLGLYDAADAIRAIIDRRQFDED